MTLVRARAGIDQPVHGSTALNTNEPTNPTSAGPPVAAGLRRSIAIGVLSLGLLAVGGTAAVLAASPEPSANPSPGATTQPSDDGSSGSSTRPARGDCPDKEGDASGGGTDNSDDGATTEPSQAPTTTPSDVTDSDL
jgi:hypothetical protein